MLGCECMIYDSLDNVGQYKGLFRNLDTVIEYLLSNSLEELPIGKTEIDGDYLFVNVVNNKLSKFEDSMFELHKRYLDMHINIVGCEEVLFTNYDESKINKKYDESEDYALQSGEVTARCKIDNKHFVICMLNEPHMPCIGIEDGTKKKNYI